MSRPAGCLAAVYLAATAAARLRVAEALALRVKDVDLKGGALTVRGGSRGDWREPRQTEQSEARRVPEPGGGSGINGDKDRTLTLPKTLLGPLREHLKKVRRFYDEDRREGRPGVMLPHAMAEKTPSAAMSWPWFWFFPSKSQSIDPRSAVERRHHLHEIGVTRELARAAGAAGLTRRVTAHVLRHSFATHLILRGVDICRPLRLALSPPYGLPAAGCLAA